MKNDELMKTADRARGNTRSFKNVKKQIERVEARIMRDQKLLAELYEAEKQANVIGELIRKETRKILGVPEPSGE